MSELIKCRFPNPLLPRTRRRQSAPDLSNLDRWNHDLYLAQLARYKNVIRKPPPSWEIPRLGTFGAPKKNLSKPNIKT